MNILTQQEAWQLQIIFRCMGQFEVTQEIANENDFNLMIKNEIIKVIHGKLKNGCDEKCLHSLLGKLDEHEFAEMLPEIIDVQLNDESLLELRAEIGKTLKEKREAMTLSEEAVLSDLKNNSYTFTNAYGYSSNFNDSNIVAKIEAGEDVPGFDCFVSDYATYIRSYK